MLHICSITAQGGCSSFCPSTFVYGRFSPKIQFLYCLLSLLSPWGAPMKGMKLMSLDRWKINFQHSFKLQKYSLYIVDKHDFFSCEYYGLVISFREIDHTGPYGAGYQRNRNYLCIVNEHGPSNCKRLVPDLQDWP